MHEYPALLEESYRLFEFETALNALVAEQPVESLPCRAYDIDVSVAVPIQREGFERHVTRNIWIVTEISERYFVHFRNRQLAVHTFVRQYEQVAVGRAYQQVGTAVVIHVCRLQRRP